MDVDFFVARSKTILAVTVIVGIFNYLGDLLATPFRWAVAFSALSKI